MNLRVFGSASETWLCLLRTRKPKQSIGPEGLSFKGRNVNSTVGLEGFKANALTPERLVKVVACEREPMRRAT
jgi:hypothetical protein